MNTSSEDFLIKTIDSPEDMAAVEALEQVVWPGESQVPAHLLLAAVRSGGVLAGAYDNDSLVGFVFSFPGLRQTEKDTLTVKHLSHILAVHPDYRNQGLGFMLKRAQWQLVRQQGLNLITWTYDPLESRNAALNITKLGAVCNTYYRNYYGEMQDGLNVGIPSDRFQVDWWVNSPRVNQRLSRNSRRKLDLAHYLAAEAEVINTTRVNAAGWPVPAQDQMDILEKPETRPPLTLFEIPADFQGLKAADIDLAMNWRMYSRTIFELFFHHGYLVTDVVYLPGSSARAYYVLSQGNSTLGG